MYKVLIFIGLAVVCLLVASAALAQQVTIRTSAQEVALDLVVRDSKGRQVKNLQAGEVEILEDGVRQNIKSFRLVPGREVLDPKKGTQAKASGASTPLPAVNLVCLVFHNLDPYNRKYAVEAAQEFLKNNLQPDTFVGVFSLDTRLSVLYPFTTNRQELLQASTNAFAGHTVDFARVADSVLNAAPSVQTMTVSVNGKVASGGTVTASANVAGGTINSRAVAGADVSNDAGANAMRGDMAAQRRAFGGIEGRRQMDQLDWMIDQFGALPGRKTVLLLSPGVATTGDVDLFQAMLSRANKAQISVYGIDINGLTENSSTLASGAALGHAGGLSATQGQRSGAAPPPGVAVVDSGAGAANMEKMRQGDYTIMAVRTSDTQASLRALAEGTGGFLIGNTNDLRKPFQRVLEDVDTHYEVLYHPSSEKYDGRLRSVQVKLARADLSVESRKGYFAMPALSNAAALAPFELTALAALNVPSQPHAFNFRSAAFQFRPTAAGSQAALVFQIPAAGLSTVALPALKRHRLHVSLLALVKDSNGQIVDKFSQDSPYEIPDASLEPMLKSTIPFTHAVDLPSGQYTVETVILDRESNQASTGAFEFENCATKGIAMSSIMLVQRMEPVNGQVDASNPFEYQGDKTQGRRVIPELAANLNSDAHPFVYFVVYPNKANPEKAKIEVQFMNGTQVLAKQTAELPAADATGAVPMVVGAAAHAGSCELKITAMQGSESTVETLRYNVASK